MLEALVTFLAQKTTGLQDGRAADKVGSGLYVGQRRPSWAVAHHAAESSGFFSMIWVLDILSMSENHHLCGGCI